MKDLIYLAFLILIVSWIDSAIDAFNGESTVERRVEMSKYSKKF